MRTISMINWKGGVGKTTLSTNTAYMFGDLFGLRVLFIDLDKQGNASSWFGADATRGSISNIFRNGTDAEQVASIRPMSAREVVQKTRYPSIDIIPSDESLLDINLALAMKPIGRQDNILLESLREISRNYDICVIDNPPDSNITVLNGIEMSEYIIAVTLPNWFSVNGIKQLDTELRNYNSSGLDAKICGVVVNRFTSTTGTYEILDYLRSRWRILPHIRTNRMTQKRLDDCINYQKSIFEISPTCQFARDLRGMLQHVVQAG